MSGFSFFFESGFRVLGFSFVGLSRLKALE